jgi:hypothetical protein
MPPLAKPTPSDRRGLPVFCMFTALLALCAAAKPILHDTLDPDCFWHLRVGEQLLREGVRPLRDSLSFASTRDPWTPYSWLAEIAMVKLWASGGFRSAILATSLLMGGTILFVAAACRAAVRGSLDDGPADALTPTRRRLPTLLAVAFAAYLSLPYLSFRPVTLAVFILSVCGWLLLRDRARDERSLAVWLVVPLTIILANVHLYALAMPVWCGMLLLGAIWERYRLFDPADRPEANRCLRRYAVLTIAVFVACLETPLLPGVISTTLHYGVRDPMIASGIIDEMQPFYHGAGGKVALALVLLFAIAVFRRNRRLRTGEMLWLLAASVMLLRLGRFAPLFALIAAPALAVTIPRMSDVVLARPGLRIATAAVLALGLVRVANDFPARDVRLDAWLNRHGAQAPGYPAAAATFVASAVPRATGGRIINESNWGGYLAWRLGDRFKVLLDGRTQVYSPQFWQETYLGADESRRRFLASVQADAAVLPARGSIFRAALVSLGWRLAYHDERAEVLLPPPSTVARISAD